MHLYDYIPNLYEICGPKSSVLPVGEQKQTATGVYIYIYIYIYTPVAVSSTTEYVRIL